MEQQLLLSVTTEAALSLPVARVQIIHRAWGQPFDVCATTWDTYWLDACLVPRVRDAQACFRGGAVQHGFEPIGDLFVVPPGQSVRARGDRGLDISIICEFEPRSVDAWFDGDVNWNDHRLRSCLNVPSHSINRSLHRIADEIRNPGFASEALCELLAATAAIDLARHCNAAGEFKASGGLAPWRLNLIEARLAEPGAPPALSELAKLSNLSVRQLNLGFRTSRGCSIGDYIVECQVNKAKRLLATDASVKEIAYSLGFTSPANFSTAFHRAVGTSPRDFRQRLARLN